MLKQIDKTSTRKLSTVTCMNEQKQTKPKPHTLPVDTHSHPHA